MKLFASLFRSYTALPDAAQLLLVLLAVTSLYHFSVFRIWNPANKRRIFWQFAGYFMALFAGYYAFRRFSPASFSTVFENIYAVRFIELVWRPLLDQAFSILPVAVSVLLFQRPLAKLLAPKKSLKHGPSFSPTAAAASDGIAVGRFCRDVVPAHIRDFTPPGEQPLVVPYNRLSRGITVLGDMGSGKSRLMNVIHDGIREQFPRIPLLIHDPKGEWLRTYYNPATDIIFAPFDHRSATWSLWNDFTTHPELKHAVISTAIESHHSGNQDRFWTDSAVMLLKDAAGEASLQHARSYLLRRRDTNAADRTFQSILATALIGFRDIATIDLVADPSSKTIDDLLSFPGRIFLLNSPSCSAEQHGALTLLLSAFLLKAISLPDVEEGALRAAVFIDEALMFRLPADVERVVYSQSRSKGLSIVASAQRLPDAAFGERGGWSSGTANIFAMRVSDMATRSALSQRLGSVLYADKQQSVSQGKDHSSTTESDVERHHAALAPEDFGQLKNRQFVLFHEHGIAPGLTLDHPGGQRADINPLEYRERKDVSDFLKAF